MALDTVMQVLADTRAELVTHEIGRVVSVGPGVAQMRGLTGVQAEELVELEGGLLGMAYNLDPDEVGVVLLGAGNALTAGSFAHRTGRILDVPVGDELLGRVVGALGNPLDELGPVRTHERQPVERPAPPILHRAPVARPLQTGLKVIDSLLPIGRGQRELILGDRQTGKTAIALDTILNQHDQNVICVYCSIGRRTSEVAEFLTHLRRHNALPYSIIVAASGDEPPGVQYIAPYAATTIAEYFMEQGRDVLIVYDDLTRHARAYRELSLLMRRPPGREAYPGDIFYVHSRLLERATQLRPEHGGGSLTALPIAETQSQNISAYIPTNLISITDGQIVLSPTQFRKGILPAVDVGRSVSRVGGKAQLPCYRAVTGQLRLSYTQFEELEIFARFGTRLDETSVTTLERGRRVREVLRQLQYRPMPVAEQVTVLLAAGEGLLNGVPVTQVARIERAIRIAVLEQLSEICQRMESGEPLTEEDRTGLMRVIGDVLAAAGEVVV
ncbi:MAG: alternate F1F0 ATPase, F1 subunit alpha [Desulfobulbus sp.]|nr:alternate F1F0 ATPase, F1 subunit alpha [Desulfobulbus sp.]